MVPKSILREITSSEGEHPISTNRKIEVACSGTSAGPMHWNESDAADVRRFQTTAVNAVQGAYFQLAIWSHEFFKTLV